VKSEDKKTSEQKFSLGNKLNRNLIFLIGFVIMTISLGVFAFQKTKTPRTNSPEAQLYLYIETAVNVVQLSQRQDLLRLTEGGLKSSIAAIDDQTFREAYVDKQYQINSFELVKTQELDDREIQIDFRISYKSWSPGEDPAQIPTMEMLNRALLVFRHGRWAISSVESLNAAYEWSVGIPVMSAESLDPNADPKEVISNRQESLDQSDLYE
jgi:hypothetical protein